MRSLIKVLAIPLLGISVLTGPAFAKDGVLVFGATGELGQEIVSALAKQGEDITAFVRPSSNRTALEPYGVKFVVGDVLNEDDVMAALESSPHRVVIDALARDSTVDPYFYVDSMKYIAASAKATGVQQVILHGSVGAGLSYLSDRNQEEELGALMIAKGFGERHLIESGMPYTIIRNWALLPTPAKESGQAFMTDDQSARGLITRDALARFTIECLDQAQCINKIFHTVDDAVDAPERYRSSLKAQRDWEASQK